VEKSRPIGSRGISPVKKSQSTARLSANSAAEPALATAALAQQMNTTSDTFPPGVNEMEQAGLAAAPSVLVKPPRVAASPANLECRLLQILKLHDLNGAPTRANLVLGQVVGVHIDKAFLKDGAFDTAAAQPLARCGALGDYAIVRELIDMRRPGNLVRHRK